MPIVEGSKINWAADVDDVEAVETVEENGFKKVIEYKMEDEKKFKVTNVFLKLRNLKCPKVLLREKNGPSLARHQTIHRASTRVPQ